jgi:hypothetical protein
MAGVIIQEFRWPPSEISNLYADRLDYLGIEYQYDFVLELQQRQQKPK